MRYADTHGEFLGQAMVVPLTEGPQILSTGYSLHVESVEHLLLKIYESLDPSHIRSSEILALWRVFSAHISYAMLEDEEDTNENMPGLTWLCEQSVSFQLIAASVIEGVSGRMRLFIDALCRATKEGINFPQNLYWGEFGDGSLDEGGAQSILLELQCLSELRGSLGQAALSAWQEAIDEIFDKLSSVGSAVWAPLLSLARSFRDDLERKNLFRLAFLEQVAGDPLVALGYYLRQIRRSEQVSEVSVKNAKLLWLNSRDVARVSGLVNVLQREDSSGAHADTIQQLLRDARPRLDTLNKQDQFERTAVNRWPSLTAPARKLLSVLSSINRYSGFQELGEYAGMDEVWAQRHYNKLLELGMILTSDSGYRINPYIEPLLARESQHAVVGRIVRVQGTSAVKQVFNSQREFTIYQMLVQLCPNHLVFPNCSLQSIMSFDRMKELVADDDFGYYLRASVDIVVVSSTTYLPMLAIEVDSVWHDTERQQLNDEKKDRLFASAGIPFMRLRPVGSPTESTIRVQVAEHVDELVRSLRTDLPGYEQARRLLEDLSDSRSGLVAESSL